jgi:hypothetical protein
MCGAKPLVLIGPHVTLPFTATTAATAFQLNIAA